MFCLKNVLIISFALYTTTFLFGCGEKTATVSASNKLEASANCISCHQDANWVSPGNLQLIVEEWKKSAHNTSNGAGCADCHEPEAGHPNSCNLCHGGTTPAGVQSSANHVSKNPDKDGKCGKCHRKGSTWGTSVYDDVAMDIEFLHYSTGKRANFVSTNYINYCRKCHNPHDPTTAKKTLQQWSRSGHGDTDSYSKTALDFKARGSSQPSSSNFANYCVRCHTATGYINYITSGFSDVRALPDIDGVRGDTSASTNPRSTYTDTSREAISCNVCHDDARATDGSAYSYKVRTVPVVSAYFNYSSTPLHNRSWDVIKKQTYPDYGSSNVCVVCHTGREIGQIIRQVSAQGMDFSNQNRINAHTRVAASTLSALSGFHFYSSSAKYQNPTYFKHDLIGTASSSPANIGGTNGPCIGCHMKNNRSHYYLPVQETNGQISSILSDANVCSSCHKDSAHSAPWTITSLEEKKNGLNAALKSLQQMLLRPNQSEANSLGTYSSDSGSITYSKTSWTTAFGSNIVSASGNPLDNNATSTITAGAYTMGAAFNYETVRADPGAYTHNSLYVRRLVYDSIDWLFNGVIDSDVKNALDYLKVNNFITSGTAASDYEMALGYLCETNADPAGSLGARP